MKTLLTLFTLSTLAISGIAQTPRFQIEAFCGMQHVHHHNCTLEDKSMHRGMTMSAGFRFYSNFNYGISIVPSFQFNNIAGDNGMFPKENIVGLDVKYSTINWDRLERWNFNAETGIEWSMTNKSFDVPFYLGSELALNSYSNMFLRARLPVLASIPEFTELNYVQFRFEIGFVLNAWCTPRPKFSAAYGNPFILE